MSKIPIPVRERSISGQNRTKSVGTQTSTVGVHGDSNYDTLNKSRVGSKSVPFSSTPTTSAGQNMRRKSSNSTSDSNDSSVEMPKDLVSNVTDIRKSNIHGKSSMSNLTENNSKSRSHVNTRFTSNMDQSSQDKQLESVSKMPREKMIRFYIDDNEDENETGSEEMIHPNPSQNIATTEETRSNESDTNATSANTKEAILLRREKLSLGVGSKTNRSPRVSKKPRTRSLNRIDDIILASEDDHDSHGMDVDVQPTTSQEAATIAEDGAQSPSKKKRGKSTLLIKKINKNTQPSHQDTDQHQQPNVYDDDLDHFHHLDLDHQDHHDQQNITPHPSQDETYLLHGINLNNNSLYSNEHDSLQHQDSGLVRPRNQRTHQKVIKKLAYRQAQRRIDNMRQLVDEYDEEIRNLNEYDHLTSNVRRSERLRLKRLRILTSARDDLIDQLRRIEEEREEYEQYNVTKKSKKSQSIKVNNQFVTLRQNNEGYSDQQTRVKAQRKSKKGNLLRMIEE